MATFLHDPDDFLDYTVTIGGLAEDEVVASATAICDDDDLTVTDVDNGDASVTFWVTGGTPGTVYNVVVHIITDQGREADKTQRFRCVQR